MTFSEALGYAISGVAILAIWVGLMLLLRRSVWWYWGIDKMLETTRSIDEALRQALEWIRRKKPDRRYIFIEQRAREPAYFGPRHVIESARMGFSADAPSPMKRARRWRSRKRTRR
jgi:hypothetical protein